MFDFAFAMEVFPALLKALRITVLATVLGMVFALVVGLVFALLRRSERRWLRAPTSVVVEFLRSTPLLVQLFFLFYVLPGWGVNLSALATGILGLGLHYSAYTAEVYRAGIEGVPRGQWDAAAALNFSPARIWRSVILPQAIPPTLPALGNRFVAMFKDSVLLSAITVGEVLQRARLIGSESFRYLEPLTLVGVLFLALSIAAAWGLRIAERRLNEQGRALQ